jgi:hypothetical protein
MKEEVYGEVNREKLCRECCRQILSDVVTSAQRIAAKMFGQDYKLG